MSWLIAVAGVASLLVVVAAGALSLLGFQIGVVEDEDPAGVAEDEALTAGEVAEDEALIGALDRGLDDETRAHLLTAWWDEAQP